LEVDWFVGYYPPAENFQASLEKILKGDNTFQSLQAAYVKNPKDVAAVFGIARKWVDRYDSAKAGEKYKEVIALDPDGKGGSYTDGRTLITAPYTEHAKYYLAIPNSRGPKPDMAPLKAFIAANPQSRLVKQAYKNLASYYVNVRTPKEEAEVFFAEYTARYPDSPEALWAWLLRIIQDRGPVEKGRELAARLRELTVSNPNPGISRSIAQLYDLAGDNAKAGEVYGREFMDVRVQILASDLESYANYWADKKENLESALAMADLTLKLQPDSVYTLRSVAGIYVKAGQDAKALEIYGPGWLEKKMGEESDQDINTYASFWLGRGKNLDSALAAAKKAVELQPKAYSYWSVLSDVHAKIGNKTEAVNAAERALELAPANAKVAIKRKLDALKGPAPEKK
jgi:tetratricopeptide (TPR) repeat protein